MSKPTRCLRLDCIHDKKALEELRRRNTILKLAIDDWQEISTGKGE